MNNDDQTMATLMAHRAVLTYLVQALQSMAPGERDPDLLDATLGMLRAGMPPLFVHLPADRALNMEEAAGNEIDLIFTSALGDPLRRSP